MINILVYYVAAESGGALSVLNDFHAYIKKNSPENIKWYFVLGKAHLDNTSNIEILNYPWIKKSWLHRLVFDYFYANKIIKINKIDKVFSLQNICIPRIKQDQVLYVHQPLPFIEYSFSLFESPLFWVYQNIIARFIFNSMKKAKKVIVQTKWMKTSGIKKTGLSGESINIIPPNINNLPIQQYADTPENRKTFFFPAAAYEYKNHMVVLKACKRLKEKGINDYEIIFTLNGNEGSYGRRLKTYCIQNNLNVRFVGTLAREEVLQLYTKSVLLFPSYVETYGLPLLEASLEKSIIIAANTSFAHEILDGYGNVYFFEKFDDNALAQQMADVLNNNINYKSTAINMEQNTCNSWSRVLNLLLEGTD